MVQILEDAPSFGQQMGGVLGKGIADLLAGGTATYLNKRKEKKEAEAFKEMSGMDISGLPKETRQEFAKQFAKAKAQEQLFKTFSGQKNQPGFANQVMGSSPSSDQINPSEEGSLNIENMPLEKRMLFAQMFPGAEKALEAQETQNFREKKLASQKEEKSSEKAEKYLDEVTNESKAIREQKFSIAAARQAVEEGNAGILSGDFWVSSLHLPDQLKSASAATIDSAAKTHLISSMQSLTGRPNVFMEQQVNRAFALPGSSKEGNLARLEVLETYADMKDIVANKALEIADRYESKGMPIPGKINRMATKEAASALEKREKQSLYRLQDLMEPPEGSEALNSVEEVRKGTPLTQKKAQVIFKKANPNGDINNAKEKEIIRAERLAEGLGYDIHAFELME